MRIARTLSFYLIRETAIYCALAFFLLTVVLLAQNLLRRLESLLIVGMTPNDLRIVLECVLPIVVSYALPLAFLVGVVFALRRLGADGELEGMRSAGFGPSAMIVPLLLLGTLTGLFSAWLLNSVEHESRRELVRVFKSVAARGAILEPGKFRSLGRRLIFVEGRERNGALQGIMIVDKSDRERPYRIFADHGRYRFETETSEILLELSSGDLHLQPSAEGPDRYERILFDEFTYRLNVRSILGGDFGPVRPKQMNLEELRAVLARAAEGDDLGELDQRNPTEYAMEIHRRRSLPFAPLLFAGVGVPIALASERRGRNRGLMLCVSAAMGYYALGALMEVSARNGWLNAGIATWIPNIVFAGLALVLFAKSRERIST